MLAAYGVGILQGRPIDYESWVGLLLNIERQGMKLAAAVAQGTAAAGNPADLGREWADALALLEEQVDLLHYDINAERKTARARMRLGFPTPGT